MSLPQDIGGDRLANLALDQGLKPATDNSLSAVDIFSRDTDRNTQSKSAAFSELTINDALSKALYPGNIENVSAIPAVLKDAGEPLKPTPIDFEKYKNNALEGYKKALEEGKPLVLVMGNPYCGFCKALKAEMEKPEMAEFANKAVFVYTNPGDEEGYDVSGKVFADALGVRGYPTISIIEPNASKIIERARIEGFFPGSMLKANFSENLNPNYKPLPKQSDMMMA